MTMRSTLRSSAIWFFGLCCCLGIPLQGQAIRIAAASDLRWALEDIQGAFQKGNPQTRITITYGSSGNFYSQLINKAPFDLFLSADVSYPRNLVDRGLGVKDSLFIYGIGRVALWAPKASPIAVEKLGLEALKQPSVRKIAIANPAHAPYGRAAEAALKKAGLLDELKDKLVLGENISQAAQFVQTGNADLGFIALSLATAGPMKDQGRYWVVPQEDHPVIEQGGVILSWAQDPAATRAFRNFLMSAKGTAIMKQYGFTQKAP